MGNGFRRGVAVAGLAVALGSFGCGDPETDDDRGFYTKAPLEDATFFVDGEDPAPVAELGDPIRIPRVLPDGRIAGPDEQDAGTAAGQAAPQGQQPAPQQQPASQQPARQQPAPQQDAPAATPAAPPADTAAA